MDILQFILEEGLVMIVALWIIGYVIKKSKLVKSEWVPFLLLAISLVITPLKLGGYTIDNMVQAVLVTGASVLGHQFVVNGEKLLE